jgi:hypothetical protein
MLPLVAPPSHLPWLVVASPLVAPPLPPLTPFRLLLRIPHPPPEGFSFGRWTPADEWTKMEALLGFWLGGGMWCIFNTPEKSIEVSYVLSLSSSLGNAKNYR